MFTRTPPALLFGFGGKKKQRDMGRVLEGHFWGLTRYRILPYFLGLDYAGNVIFFRSYRTQRFGGWSAVTLGAPGSTAASFLGTDMSAVNVLEDGYPLHHKASKKLQQYVAEERRRWDEKVKKAAEEAAKMHKEAEGGKGEGEGEGAGAAAAADAKKPAAASANEYDSEQQFRDTLAIRVSNPKFYSRRLRVSPLGTFVYKCFYYYLWAVLVSLVIQGYLMFRSWVNAPARAGLRNLEEHVMHVPRLLFAACVHGVAWLARTCQPIIDPIVALLREYFPGVDWNIASAENLANRAEHLANDTHPSAKERHEVERKLREKNAAERRTWLTRVLLVLLAIFSVLCVL